MKLGIMVTVSAVALSLLNQHFSVTDPKGQFAPWGTGSQNWEKQRFRYAFHKNSKAYPITQPKFWSFLRKKIIGGHVLLA